MTVGTVSRDLPLMEVAAGLRIAVLNMLGDTELVEAAATLLAGRLARHDYDTLVTPEAKSIPLAHALSVRTGHPYVVLRKTWKPYMGEDALRATTHSITTGSEQTLYLDAKDRHLVEGRRVVLVDDVISTGSTLAGMEEVMALARASVIARAAVCTEGDDPGDAIALAHLPLFPGQ
ncbi:phosphoribosyltransferase family protein [Aquisalimonas asiatica]|uniref:phosphoribosyltransferase family protein n=1 Tax=Aquisalimonas asiatica TaxID=406100 RepID=UPI001C0B2EFB|nr:phosphoribosyltransferase family protein [Aquisalimonas asiatica]